MTLERPCFFLLFFFESCFSWKPGKKNKIATAPGSAELCGNNRKRTAGTAAVRTRRDSLLPKPAPPFLPSVSVRCICVNSIPPPAPLTQCRHLEVINPQAAAATAATYRWPNLPLQHNLINPPRWRRWRKTSVGVTRPRGSFASEMCQPQVEPQNDLSTAH